VKSTSTRISLYRPAAWPLEVSAATFPPATYPFAAAISVRSALTALAATGAMFVSKTFSVSAPRLCFFSATAWTNELNLLNAAMGYVSETL
jgi:hypothetical protein